MKDARNLGDHVILIEKSEKYIKQHDCPDIVSTRMTCSPRSKTTLELRKSPLTVSSPGALLKRSYGRKVHLQQETEKVQNEANELALANRQLVSRRSSQNVTSLRIWVYEVFNLDERQEKFPDNNTVIKLRIEAIKETPINRSTPFSRKSDWPRPVWPFSRRTRLATSAWSRLCFSSLSSILRTRYLWVGTMICEF